MSSRFEAIHRRARRDRPPALADFMDNVWLHMSRDERESLPTEMVADYIEAIVTYAVERLPEFGEALAEVVAGVYEQSPIRERFLPDPPRFTEISMAVLFLDSDGQLVTVTNPEFIWRQTGAEWHEQIQLMTRYQSYQALTGPHAGSKFSVYSRPLPEMPVYRAGVVSEWFHQSTDSGGRP